MLIDLEPQAAVSVIFGQLAERGVCGGVGGQTLFKRGIVGVDFSGAVVFVEAQFGDFVFLLRDFFV